MTFVNTIVDCFSDLLSFFNFKNFCLFRQKYSSTGSAYIKCLP